VGNDCDVLLRVHQWLTWCSKPPKLPARVGEGERCSAVFLPSRVCTCP